MYDKIFKPKKYTLANGKVVEEKASRTLFYTLILLLIIIFAGDITGFEFSVLVERGHEFFTILGKMFPPNFSYINKVWNPLFDTIKMSLIGSILGALLAVPFAIFASSNINHSKTGLAVFRFIISLIRTFPTIVVALIATYIFGLGTMAGTIAIFVFTFSYIGKQLYETIETVDMGAFEAATSMGSTRVRAFITAIMPQILPTYLSVSLYCFEGNVRYAAILGYVGAGGIGIIINNNLGLRNYDNVGMIITVLFLAVVFIESLSHYIRSKLT